MDLDKMVIDNKEYAFEILGKLISYDTVLREYKENSDMPFGKNNAEALNYLLSIGDSLGFKTKNLDNYAGHIEFGEGEEILGILAHLDVVPVTIDEWKTNPFELVIKDNKLYGRGTQDDKGPLVSALIAMKLLKDEGFKPSKRIRLIAGCDEESGSRCLEYYLKKEKTPDIAFSPDAEFPLIYGEKAILSYDIMGSSDGIILEFNAGERYNMVPSMASMKISLDLKDEYFKFLNDNNFDGEVKDNVYYAYGIASHAAMPDKGLNAIFILFKFLSEYTDSKIAKFINKYYLFDNYGKKAGYYSYDKELGDLTSNVAIFKLKDNEFKMGVNCRCPIDESFDIIDNVLNKICGEFNYSYKKPFGSKRHYVSPKSELVTKLLGAYREVTKDYSDPITIGGGTYAREMKNAVAFGPLKPGRVDCCHISNEYFEIDDFMDAIKVYYLAIKELAK
ncbi:MAG: dipeptidase PepV [Acholeplasmatales bacterium]|nr:dipeptidase PepV [Acholeplasmatales bacterium]